MKSEPAVFSIDDLASAGDRGDHWDGVRNYQARNYLRTMRRGDRALFYHSSCPQPGVVGIMEIARGAYPDPTALDHSSPYFDPKSSTDEPRWYMVDVRFMRRLRRTIALDELKHNPRLEAMALLRRGNRLSVMPVSTAEWRAILAMEGK